MKDKFIMVGLNDKRSKYIAEIMKSETSKKILDYLAETGEASEKDIAQALDIPISTVEYNLGKLIKAEFIEKAKNFFWSIKGKKIDMYKLTRKHIIISPKMKQPSLTMLKTLIPVIAILSVFVLIAAVLLFQGYSDSEDQGLLRFQSDDELIKAFENSRTNYGGRMEMDGSVFSMTTGLANVKTAEYSDTNVQVEGVDEADIIKTDGKYIYALGNGKLVIASAWPVDSAEILSQMELGDFRPNELFIDGDKLLMFGSVNYNFEKEVVGEGIRPQYFSTSSVRLYDLSDKKNPELLRTVDFEGNYLTSRKIGSDVYFVVNSYPRYYSETPLCGDIVPHYRDGLVDNPKFEDFEPVAGCTEIGYIEPVYAQNFITIASISMDDEDAEIKKETIVGNGQNVYASLENLYIAQTSFPNYVVLGGLTEEYFETTVVSKFELDGGDIKFGGSGKVKGHILNQFSMDEYDDYFRIATTSGGFWNGDSLNNVYVLDSDLDVVGELEDLAPGEKIYSVRFMGKRGYVVTFKKVDPLFVIDLSDSENPEVLGKLKIPGYSDYLHPYDETHIIGIGKDAVDASEDLITRRDLDFAWYQGVKMAIFDVSDVENPIEMHKVIIGDRGTDSEALHNHKAFLFDREKNLLVLPITLAEIKEEKTEDNQHGDYVFQGAYVYDINLEDGFDLRGRVTHYDDESVFQKSGYFFRGDHSIRRSLYIEDVLYTLSDSRLQLNDLDDLERLKVLSFD